MKSKICLQTNEISKRRLTTRSAHVRTRVSNRIYMQWWNGDGRNSSKITCQVVCVLFFIYFIFFTRVSVSVVVVVLWKGYLRCLRCKICMCFTAQCAYIHIAQQTVQNFFPLAFSVFFNSVHSLSSVVVVAAYPNTIHNINIRNINMFSVLIERRQSFLYSSIRYICACGEDDDDERHRVQARAREIANTHH